MFISKDEERADTNYSKLMPKLESINPTAILSLFRLPRELLQTDGLARGNYQIPGTGLYKKKPFFGTREERQELVEIANKILNESSLKTIQWPKDWVDEDGTKMLDILEMKQSVHLRPKHYAFLNEIL